MDGDWFIVSAVADPTIEAILEGHTFFSIDLGHFFFGHSSRGIAESLLRQSQLNYLVITFIYSLETSDVAEEQLAISLQAIWQELKYINNLQYI